MLITIIMLSNTYVNTEFKKTHKSINLMYEEPKQN